MKSIKKISLLTTLFALMLSFSFSSGHAQVSPPDSTAYMLQGKVVDAQSEAILADAEISIVGQDINTVSSEEGKFKLENLPAGEHVVKVELEGYQAWEKSMTLDQDTKLTIKLEPEKE